MGTQKYQQDIETLFRKSPVVSFTSLNRIVTRKKKTTHYAKQLVHNLLLRKKIKKVTKGWYTLHNEASLAVFCFQPSYLGLHDALSYHGLWEQETIPIIITTRKVRTGIRSVLGSNVQIYRLPSEYYFGIEHSLEQTGALPYSDIEKTCIDFAFFKQNIPTSAVNELRKRINRKKLGQYLIFYPSQIRKQVREILSKKR